MNNCKYKHILTFLLKGGTILFMSENIVAIKTIKAFSINLKDWVYEGQLICIKTKDDKTFENVVLKLILELDEEIIIENMAGIKTSIKIDEISDIEIIERRKIDI